MLINQSLDRAKRLNFIKSEDEKDFGQFYVVLKLNLKKKDYECVYSHIQDVYKEVKAKISRRDSNGKAESI